MLKFCKILRFAMRSCYSRVKLLVRSEHEASREIIDIVCISIKYRRSNALLFNECCTFISLTKSPLNWSNGTYSIITRTYVSIISKKRCEQNYRAVIGTRCYDVIVERIPLDIEDWAFVASHTAGIEVQPASLKQRKIHLTWLGWHNHPLVQVQDCW